MSLMEMEVDRNFDAFMGIVGDLIVEHKSEWALMRAGKIEAFYQTDSLALCAGRARYLDGVYSIQQVTQQPVDLGFFSHAIDTRLA